MLAMREVALRYQYSVAGIGWAVAQPLLTLLVLTAFQVLIGRRASTGVPYPLYAITGLVPWTFFGHALAESSRSLLKYALVINKVYFPRLILPISAVLAGLADFVAGLTLVPLLMIYYGYPPRLSILWLPLFILHVLALATAMGIWLAHVNTRFRDAANALPFVTQLWFFMTPIIYRTDMLPQRWLWGAGLNPMVGILEGFRWALFGSASPMLVSWVATSWLITLLLLGTGVLLFLGDEERLAELL